MPGRKSTNLKQANELRTPHPGEPGSAMGAQPNRVAILTVLLFTGCAAILLFARLGHYALWDDEAGTALTAKGVLRTLDTSALVDQHNVFAYRNGALLDNLKVRYWAPLQSYFVAPFLAALGEQSAFAARLPFALCGLGVVALTAWWFWKERGSHRFALLFCAGLLCNVSFLLYSRQCRYYALALLLSAAIARVYVRWKGGGSRLVGLGILLTLLLATNYLNYAALCGCLAVDYALWQRKAQALTGRDWVILLLPQIIAGLFIVSIWDPLGKHPLGVDTGNWPAGRIKLFWWNWRELDRSEFGSLLLLAAAPLLFLRHRNQWLLRAPVALLVYLSIVTLCSPQLVGLTSEAEIRYLAPIIPLCVAIEALILSVPTGKWSWIAVPMAVLAFGTNLFNGGPFLYPGLRSTIASYIGEIVHPPDDPFTVTARWIDEHLHEGQTVWVLPNHANYPLMFHSPQVIYAWQLSDPPAAQFAGLPPIHFQGREAPDYLIAFGPSLKAMTDSLEAWNKPGVQYEMDDVIDHYYDELYRPELFWRRFGPVTNYNRASQAIYVFKRTLPPISD
jgi:hypothetical protein